MTTCGHCKTQGVTVQHVRDCSGTSAPAPVERPATRLDATSPTLAKWPEEGVFKTPTGAVYKVQQSRSGTWYTKVLTMTGLVDDGLELFDWDYEGRRPLYFLTADMKLDADSAAQFGRVTGHCIFCGLKLTDERSISVGYGPRCAEHHSLPWG